MLLLRRISSSIVPIAHDASLIKSTLPGCRWKSTRASSIKMLNYSNKALFGRVNARANTQPTPAESTPPPPDIATPKARNDLSSEMFWLLQRKSNGPKKIVDTTMAVKKAPIKRRAPIQYAAADIELLRSLKPTKQRKNTKLYTKDRAEFVHPEADRSTIPSSLSRFGDTLCDPPVKNLSALVAPPRLLKRSSNDALHRMLNVPPFRTDGQPIGGSRSGDDDCEVVGVGVGSKVERLAVRDMPSVGKVLQATMPESSRRALMHWKQLKVAELGVDGFRELQQSHLSAGSTFHNALQSYFNANETPSANSPLASIWNSVRPALDNISAQPELIEAPIVHPILQYKGVVDCVSSVDNELSVIEWKKSDRLKVSLAATYDAPLQLCAYLGAINADPRYRFEHVQSGLVVVAYTTGAPAHSFRLSAKAVQQYWTAWLERLHEYWVRRRNGTLPEPI